MTLSGDSQFRNSPWRCADQVDDLKQFCDPDHIKYMAAQYRRERASTWRWPTAWSGSVITRDSARSTHTNSIRTLTNRSGIGYSRTTG